MKFRALQESLRRALWKRIEAGQLTGLKLARQTGFKQAHISNFLNRKRSLSLEGMDRVLSVQHLSVLDLLDPQEINKRASILPPSEGDFENVVLVDASVAATRPLLISDDVRGMLKFKKAFLHGLRPDMQGRRSSWQRFVLIRVDARLGMAMYPRLLPGAVLLIDRHYNSLAPYRRTERNMYLVAMKKDCTVRYVEDAPKHLILRPENAAYPVELVGIEAGKSAADYIVGRVCSVSLET